MKALVWKDGMGESWEIEPIPDKLVDAAEAARPAGSAGWLR